MMLDNNYCSKAVFSVSALGPCAVLNFVLSLFSLVLFPEKTNIPGQL